MDHPGSATQLMNATLAFRGRTKVTCLLTTALTNYLAIQRIVNLGQRLLHENTETSLQSFVACSSR
jgi:hypothetical protein